jgi:hypothetical protein
VDRKRKVCFPLTPYSHICIFLHILKS